MKMIWRVIKSYFVTEYVSDIDYLLHSFPNQEASTGVRRMEYDKYQRIYHLRDVNQTNKLV